MTVPPELKWELLLVDNNSNDDLREEMEELASETALNLRYIWEPRTGKSYALNRGITEATGEVIAFTDDDVLVSPDWLQELMRTLNRLDSLGVGGRCVPDWGGATRPDWLVTAGPYALCPGTILEFDFGDEEKEIAIAPWGLNMAFRRSAFEKYGVFRTDLGPSGSGRILGEDTEFGRRLLRGRDRISYSPNAIVRHPVHPQRISKDYFLRFYLGMGRAYLREDGWPADTVLYFGIPRYMFRGFLEKCTRWLFASRPEKRFYHKAQMYLLVGQMIEARAMRRRHAAAPDSEIPSRSRPEIL